MRRANEDRHFFPLRFFAPSRLCENHNGKSHAKARSRKGDAKKCIVVSESLGMLRQLMSCGRVPELDEVKLLQAFLDGGALLGGCWAEGGGHLLVADIED